MRYRDLLIILFIISTVTLLWAEPTRDLPMRREQISEAKASATSQPSQVALEVHPERDFASTEFVVTVQNTEGRMFGDAPMLGLCWSSDGRVAWLVNKPKRIGPDRWRFTGSDLLPPPDMTPPENARYFVAKVTLRDLEANPFSRGMTTIILESESVQVARPTP